MTPLVLLGLVGFLASFVGSGPLARLWDRMLTRIPGVGLVYGSTKSLGEDVACVFAPHTPNRASGFVHYVPKRDLIELDWAVEDGLKVIVSGGVVQPPSGEPATGR